LPSSTPCFSSYEKINWKSSLYKDDPEDWGLAISIGHVSWIARWDLSETTICLLLTGDNFKIMLGLLYSTKIEELIKLKKQVQDKAKKAKW
jgi:hypothetical protein